MLNVSRGGLWSSDMGTSSLLQRRRLFNSWATRYRPLISFCAFFLFQNLPKCSYCWCFPLRETSLSNEGALRDLKLEIWRLWVNAFPSWPESAFLVPQLTLDFQFFIATAELLKWDHWDRNGLCSIGKVFRATKTISSWARFGVFFTLNKKLIVFN